MSAKQPKIRVSRLSETTGMNTLTKILESRTDKNGVVLYPVKLLNIEDGDTFDLTLTTEPTGVKVGDSVEVENVTITNFPVKQRFGKEEYAMSNWSYSGEKMTLAKVSTQPQSQSQTQTIAK